VSLIYSEHARRNDAVYRDRNNFRWIHGNDVIRDRNFGGNGDDGNRKYDLDNGDGRHGDDLRNRKYLDDVRDDVSCN